MQDHLTAVHADQLWQDITHWPLVDGVPTPPDDYPDPRDVAEEAE